MTRPHHIPASLTLLAGCVIAMASTAMADGVVLRDRAEPPQGDIAAVTIEGVRIGLSTTDGGRVIAWDRILRIEGPQSQDAQPFAQLAEQAWRARIRLARGDAVGAEPLLEEVARALAGRTGPTAAGAAIGLVRCRVQRGGPVGAVPALIDFYRAGGFRAGGEDLSVWWLGTPGLTPAAPLMDPITELCPDVPPIFVRLPGVQTLARTELTPELLAPTDDAPNPRWIVMARLYHAAAAFESAAAAQLPARPGDDDRPAAWVWDIVASRVAEPEIRTQARTRLRSSLSLQTALWQEAWTRAAIGRSLLLEEESEQRWLGVAELLNLPARLGGEAPYVGGIAMAEAAVALAAMGDPKGALRVKEDMLRRYPQHPALEWDPFARIASGLAHTATLPATSPPSIPSPPSPTPQTTAPSGGTP